MTGEPAGLACPACGGPPWMVTDGPQAWCADDDCPVLCWSPALSVAENFARLHLIDLRGRE